jgi:hypothetical protein
MASTAQRVQQVEIFTKVINIVAPQNSWNRKECFSASLQYKTRLHVVTMNRSCNRQPSCGGRGWSQVAYFCCSRSTTEPERVNPEEIVR